MGVFGTSGVSSGFEHTYVRLPNPNLPESEMMQRLYAVMTNTGLMNVIFGPGDIGSCFRALLDVAPIFGRTRTKTGLLGSFPGQREIHWFAIQGSRGSAIVISFGPESDDEFRQFAIDGRLSHNPLRPPFTWGTILGGSATDVPMGFAEIFQYSASVQLPEFPGLQHLGPAAPPPSSSIRPARATRTSCRGR